ncbi:MAG: hypothetical protein FJ243_02630 [Nitrospira sp.]|nr:hypothetical protein [Nitrospira sp.]
MTRRFVQIFIIISLALGIGPLSRASQPLPSVEKVPAYRGERRTLPSAEEREQVRKRINLIRMWRLTEELNLDEETGAKLFPLLRQHEEKRRELAKKREELLFALKAQLKTGKPHEDKISVILREWEEIHTEEENLSRREKEDLREILSIEQRAKYLIFQHEFTKEMRRMIADVREKKQSSVPSRLDTPAKP